ncbi:MAG TPA: ferritin-like domain-containing protein [Thermoleophilaceae bacterium]
MRAPELQAVEVEGITRSAFILRGALAAGAVYGLGAVAPFVSSALGAAADDRNVLAFALTLEQLESAFYRAAAGAGLTGQAQTLAKTFGAHEDQHVQTLTQLITQLGAKPAAAPKTKFGLSDQASFLKLAVTLEDTGVAAYNGAAPLLKTVDVLSALGSIVNVEARHSAALRTLAGQDPAPQAFDKPMNAPQVAAAIGKFIQ